MNTTAISMEQEQIGLPRGPWGIVSHFTNNQVASKLMSMGVLPGSRMELIRKAPLGGGWYVRIDQQLIALRNEEVACIAMR